MGYICGLGSVGTHLSTSNSSMGLFTSIDGGLTWNESLKGAYIFTATEDGGLLLAAPFNSKTDSVFVSYNWGVNWTAVQIHPKNHAVYVVDLKSGCMLNQPCTTFWVTFRERKNPKFEKTNRLTWIDVRKYLYLRNCTGLGPSGLQSITDFEKFHPHEPGSDCNLSFRRFHGQIWIHLQKEERSCLLFERNYNCRISTGEQM